GAARRIADPGDVALIERHTDDGVGPDAAARLAGVGLGAGIAVAARATFGRVRVGARAARRIADPGDVALIERRADDGVGPDAAARLAGVGLGAGITVGAGPAVGLVRVGAGAARRIADAGVVALVEGGADDRVRSRA